MRLQQGSAQESAKSENSLSTRLVHKLLNLFLTLFIDLTLTKMIIFEKVSLCLHRVYSQNLNFTVKMSPLLSGW